MMMIRGKYLWESFFVLYFLGGSMMIFF